MPSVRRRAAGFVASVAVVTVLLDLGGSASASKKPSIKLVDPVTMGSLQIVNALDGDSAVTVSVGGRVRARGVPSLEATAPVVVPSGDQVIRLGDSAEAIGGSLALNVPAGSRRTLFLLGPAEAPSAAIVDVPERLTNVAARTARILDLRPLSFRTDVQVDGDVRVVDASGLSAAFSTDASARVFVDGVSTTPNLRPGTSIVFVTRRDGRSITSLLRQDLVGLDSLRSPVTPIVKVRQSPVRLVGALALMVAATMAALSSMAVFRSRSRDDRTRGLMAKSFGL